MAPSARTTATFLLLTLAFLLMAAGCSQDSPVAPVQTDVNEKAAVLEPHGPGTEGFYIETFDSRRNVGRWSFQTTNKPVFEESGGNPGGYLHDDYVVSFAPHPGTEIGVESVFTGNYREKKVASLGVDLRCHDYDYDITSRFLTLILMNDNGTPQNLDDDWGAYVIGDVNLPSKYVAWKAETGTLDNEPGWVNYDFAIHSQTNGLPEGWTFMRWTLGGGDMPGGSWAELMADVSYIQYYYGDPELVYILQNFDLGLDNARISFE